MGDVLDRIQAKMAAGVVVPAIEIAQTRRKEADADLSIQDQLGE
jgi:hypothetical protein